MSINKSLVSVIIASYQQKKYIFDALRSIYAQEADFPYEVIVVDSSGDDTAELVRNQFPKTIVISLPERTYPGIARNHGMRTASGGIFAFTDTDCIVDRCWLQRLVDANQSGHPVVGGMVKNGTPYSINGTLDYLMEFSEQMTPFITTAKDHLGTANVSFLRSIYNQYGFFDDQVKGSDNMYFRQMYAEGQVLYWDPQAIVWHRNRTHLRKILCNQFDLGFGAAINRKKYAVKGKIFVHYPFLIPLIPMVRTFTIGGRIFRNSNLNFIKFVLLLPLVEVCLISYTAGFFHGLKK